MSVSPRSSRLPSFTCLFLTQYHKSTTHIFHQFHPFTIRTQYHATNRYYPDKNVIVWNIKQFTGGKEFLMRAHFGLPSVQVSVISI